MSLRTNFINITDNCAVHRIEFYHIQYILKILLLLKDIKYMMQPKYEVKLRPAITPSSRALPVEHLCRQLQTEQLLHY
jgi:hypothetical protein